MYVRLKHALSTLALEAVTSPARSVERAAVAGLVAFCDRCGGVSLPEPFRPHFPYMNRQVHRTAAVLRALETSRGGPRPRGKAAAIRIGAALFNGGLFFECHEYLEDLWRATPPGDRSFYQGIILIAAGFYHYEKGNLHGARTKLAAGIAKLKPYLPTSHGVRLDRWMASLTPWLARIDAGAAGVLDTSEIPKIVFAFKRASR